MEGKNRTDLRLPGENQILAERCISRIARQNAHKITLRTEKASGYTCVHRIPKAVACVGCVVAMVLNIARRKNADANRLQELRDQERRDIYVPRANAAIGEACKQRRSAIEALCNLDRSLGASR